MAINRKYTITGGAILLAVVALAFFYFTRTAEKTPKYYEVKKGKFEAVLSCKGEINGLVATVIRAPKILGDRELELWSLKIIDLTQDGKNVKKGEIIGFLGRSGRATGFHLHYEVRIGTKAVDPMIFMTTEF